MAHYQKLIKVKNKKTRKKKKHGDSEKSGPKKISYLTSGFNIIANIYISYNSNVTPNCAPMRDITLGLESKTHDIKGHSILNVMMR